MIPENNNIIKEYLEQIKNNVQQAVEMQNLAQNSAILDDDGNWSFIISQKDALVSETISLGIKKENVSFLAPDEMVEKCVWQYACEAVLQNDPEFKKSGKSLFGYYTSLQGGAKIDIDDKVEQYKKNTPKLKFEATRDLLISNGVMPKIVNRALQQSARTGYNRHELDDFHISVENDEGYCTKSLFMPLYELKDRYGGFEWLPESAEGASHPVTVINHLKTNKENSVSSMVNLNSEIITYQPGAIVMIHKGNGSFHAMMYNGINDNTGKPQYLGFNSNDFNRSISDKRNGIIINLPQMIQEDINAGRIKINESLSETLSVKNNGDSIFVPEKKAEKLSEEMSRGEKAELVQLKIQRLRGNLQEKKVTPTTLGNEYIYSKIKQKEY